MTNIANGAGHAAPTRPIPERIKEAREARGYTLEAFAETVGVSKSAIAQFETGQTAPSGETLASILRITNQPVSFFTKRRDRAPEHSPFWRSLKRMDLHHRKRVARRLAWAGDVVAYVERFIDLPPVNLPQVEFDFDADDVEEIESLANELRDHWKLGRGPISDLVGTLEINGVLVVQERVGCPDMDAVSCWQDGRPFILLAEEDKLGPRINFNLAHELAHIVLHALVEVDAKNLDRVEKQANRFASAFLLPQESFGSEVLGTSLGYLATLKLRWGVAIAAMGYRAKDLGIFNKNQYSYLLRQMNAKNIRKKEPYDEDIVVSRPSILSHSMRMLIDHGVQSKAQIASAISLNLSDVEALCGLPAGLLDDKIVDFQKVISLKQTDRYA
jgi:Zn-dependent peptidase ImmA (M78 family)/DNA-binding XRE family transcriptional regulator